MTKKSSAASPAVPPAPLPGAFTTPMLFFFFNDTATTEIYTLSLHDALPISRLIVLGNNNIGDVGKFLKSLDSPQKVSLVSGTQDRKSTRLNSSHSQISY